MRGRPKGGEKTGGRQKGSTNKATAEIRQLAQVYTAQALKRLAYIMEHGESEQACVAACKELLDRGHGKPAAALDVNLTGFDPLEYLARLT